VAQQGVVAAGHPASAAAGAAALRAGGNAVDAAVAAVVTSFVAEPLLTGLGAGGYLLVAPPEQQPVLLDFFVETPGRGAARPAPMTAVVVSFEGATQVFEIGASSCATFGVPAGVAAAVERFGRMPLAELTGPAARLARTGVRLNAMQAYVFGLLADVVGSTPETAARFLVDGRPPREGELLQDLELADALDRLGAEGAAPFYTGDIGRAVSDWVRARGGGLTRADLEAYRVVERTPLCATYRGREIFTTPPPGTGGRRLVRSLLQLESTGGVPDAHGIAAALEAGEREPAGAKAAAADRLGSTTHVSVLDDEGWACSVTCSNGTGSGVTVPGTGIHINNMLGEHDLLVPRGVGVRLGSSMAPTVVHRDGTAEFVVGSAGSSRIRSALLQVLVNLVDRGVSPQQAVDAPRLHVEGGSAYAEPGIDVEALKAAGCPVTSFFAPNLFFGGCQAVRRDVRTGALDGGADARRCGAVVVV
jgi:gamma-glutamyltranspeptidase/glutathione hydrolase